ncbi:MAG: hypothetical protein EOM24_06145 [Chloroflexia bacterium]|nr:hypothetical protein [Chloroflexia bacterium]
MPELNAIASGIAFHSAYGLIWRMPFTCPELRAAPPGRAPDVVVRWGDVPPAPPSALAAGPLRQVTPGEARFGLPGVARLLVRGGNEILIERQPEADDEMIRLLLIGTGVALLLHQRGLLPLHASAVVTPAGAALFMGHSGAGKSTLLNEFLHRGYPMLAEDLAAVRLDTNGVAWVEPGVQITKLWADSAAELGQSTDGLPRVRPELEKFVVPVANALTDAPTRLAAIYVLSSHNQPTITLEERRDARKFNALLDHTWQKLVVKRMGLHAAHFQRAIAVANQARIVRVQRPDDGFRLRELADAVEADFVHNRSSS